MARRRSSSADKGLPLPALRPVEEADGNLLRRRWRSIMGRHAPKRLSPALMARILTWREQVVEAGDISSRSRAILAAAIRGADERAERGGKPEAGPIAKRSPRVEPIRRGTVLVREHAGVLHRVTVAGEGFEWDGRMYGASPPSPAPSPASTGADAASSVSTEALRQGVDEGRRAAKPGRRRAFDARRGQS